MLALYISLRVLLLRQLWPRWLAGWALSLVISGCQLRGEQVQADSQGVIESSTSSTSLGAEAAMPSPIPAAIPDSLALTPVPALPYVPSALAQAIGELHAGLGPEAAELRTAVLTQACVGYLALRQKGRACPGAVLAVADFDLPNTTRRLWVIDLKRQKILHRSLVAHGRGSGYVRARRFSGKMKSACTTLGFYRTADTYDGKHGLSRRLQGLDQGQNSTAEDRYVVLHGADYASPQYVAQTGHLGYSRGCPALPPEQYETIIRSLPAGHVLLLSGPGLASRWLDGVVAGQRFAAHGWL